MGKPRSGRNPSLYLLPLIFLYNSVTVLSIFGRESIMDGQTNGMTAGRMQPSTLSPSFRVDNHTESHCNMALLCHYPILSYIDS